MSIVGIAGRKFHGKDTAAREFVEAGYVQMRFADPIKEMLRAFYRLFSFSEIELERKVEGDLKEVACPYLCGRTPRYAMQTLGTEWGRKLMDDQFWIKALVLRSVTQENVVVSDVRFHNEVEAIHQEGGTVYRVDANERVPANEFSAHPSEQDIDHLEVDKVLPNNGSPDQFKALIAEEVFGER